MVRATYSVYIRKRRANVVKSLRLCSTMSMLFAKVYRKNKNDHFYRFEDMPQPKYGINESQRNEIVCNLVKFVAEDEADSVKSNQISDIHGKLKAILGVP